MSEWIKCSERLPELRQSVALLNINVYENTGGDWIRKEQNVGYLNECGHKYWSTPNSRGKTLDAYTHWTPLPEPPTEEAQDET